MISMTVIYIKCNDVSIESSHEEIKIGLYCSTASIFIVKDMLIMCTHLSSSDRSAFAKRKPGIRFTEKMLGTFTSTKNQKGGTPCEFTVTIESQDVESMINCDPAHAATISGTVTCPALSMAPMTVTAGN